MFRFLKSRAFLGVLGLILLSLFIWYAGPYFEFADYRPLESENARFLLMALVVAVWIVSALLKRLRANRASDKLVAAVVQQAQAEPNPEAARLREQFEEAVAALKQKRRSGHSLYDLPWYVIIGAPGSGKTTALVNSGLNFPLEQRTGKGALRGVGGTRNCDWWFTDEAIFLDTAGRYTTQDSDASSDSAGWIEFLALLKKYRKRRPVNGVILTISAQDLMVHGQREREAYVAAARRRLDELNKELAIQLPVYLMVTKCDLVAGFTEYFDDLAQDGRAQVWGVTFPYDQTRKGGVAQALPEEFEALIARLNERVFTRLDEERDARRRAKIFGFPQQVAALREVLVQFVSEVFESTRFDRQILLRGVYFTSGTQEGTPIDRLLGSIGRRFAVAPEAVMAPTGRGKAYFIEHLLKRVLLAESGLAGVNRRLEVKKAAAQLGAYAAMIAVAVLGVIAFTVSYNRNSNYIGEVAVDAAELEQTPTVRAGATVERLLPRLDAVRSVADSANRYPDGPPWVMRFGLYQGGSIGNAARDAYMRELHGALLPAVASRFRQRLLEYASEPETMYEYLKAYLMLGQPEHLNKTHLGILADAEWKAAYAHDPDTGASVTKHFRSLLENDEDLRAIPLDQSLVAQAQRTIQRASIPRLMYSQIKLAYAASSPRDLQLDVELGLGASQVFRRKSGAALSNPVPSLYTAAVFKEITGRDTERLVKEFAADSWVWGEERLPLTASTKLAAEVNDIYETDYIAAWDAIMNDITLVPLPNLTKMSEVLAILAGSTSPMRGLLQTVDANTFLVKPAQGTAPGGFSLTERLNRGLNKGKEAIGLQPVVEPGTRTTAHFAPIHRMVAGEAGSTQLDPILRQIKEIEQQLGAAGSGLGDVSPLVAITQPGPAAAIRSLQQEAASLPPVIGGLVRQISGRTEAIAAAEGGNELENRYRQEVLSKCTALGGRYPFSLAGDVPLADFGRLFGYGGVFDTFFKERLELVVDTQRTPWTFRSGGSGASIGVSPALLRQFEMASRIRETFFRPGSMTPEATFDVTPVELDPAVARFLLEIDGQSVEDRHGAERTTAVRWPGPKPSQAVATFEDKSTVRTTIGLFDGPWAWFKLVDSAQLQREGASERYLLTFEKDGHKASVLIEAKSVDNPFGNREWRQFRCG